MKTYLLYTIVCLLTAILFSCSGNGSEILSNDNPNNEPGTKISEGNILKSIVARDTSSAPESDIGIVVEGNNAFAWSMFNKLFDKNSNLVFSPYSISAALSMTLVGARGETQTEMTQALMLPLIGKRFHAVMNTLDRQLKSRGQNAAGREGEGFSLKVNNAIWGERTVKFSLSFLDTLSRYYDAGIGLCDFMRNPDSARLKINSWITDKTENKIQDMLGPGTIHNLTRLVITNTIYFDAAWADTFEPKKTYKLFFFRSNGDTMNAWYMNRIDTCNYSENDYSQAIEIPYSGNQVSMIFILPKDKQFLPSESNINNTAVNGLLTGFSPKKVAIIIPKFSFTFGAMSIKPQLEKIGMQRAFSDQADFSGINDSLLLMISDVLHQAYISVDEKGTTAAAATSVIVVATGMPEVDAVFCAEHPFIFLIRDNPTGQALFIGYISEPTKAE